MNSNKNIPHSYLYSGDNCCLIRDWNGLLNWVSLDHLKRENDPNTKIWSVKLKKFVDVPEMVLFEPELVAKFTLTRFRIPTSIVDVIDTCPSWAFTTPIWSKTRNNKVVIPKDDRAGCIPEAYIMGLFFVLGHIIKNKENLWEILMVCNTIETTLEFKFALTRAYHNIASIHPKTSTHKTSDAWEVHTIAKHDHHRIACYWKHIFYDPETGHKKVPKLILNAAKNSKHEFLRGFLDAQKDRNLLHSFPDKVSCTQVFYIFKCLKINVDIVETLNEYKICVNLKKQSYNNIVEMKPLPHDQPYPNMYQIVSRDKFPIGLGFDLIF